MGSSLTLSCIAGIVALACTASVRADDDRPADAETRDHQLLLSQNSFSGPTGGIRVVDASSGPKGTFRLALNTEFFLIGDFFVPDDAAHHFAGNLSLSVTPTEYLEVFASAEVTSAWDDSTNPMLVQRVADALIGLKGFHWVKPWVALGGDFSIGFPGGVGDMKATFRATSFGLRGNATLDFRARHRRSMPLIARFNAQYWFDNSAKLTESIERVGPLTPFERFAYGINEADAVRIGGGIEMPLEARKVGLHPLLDWRWDIPVNRQGFGCASASLPVGDDCLGNVGVKAYPMTLTIGFRMYTPPKGLAFTFAADIGVTGTRDFARELAPNAPYNVILGIAYAVDPRARHVPEPVSAPAPSYEPAPEGRIHGLVVDAPRGKPVANARVSVVGQEASPQTTGDDGRFITYSVPASEVALEVSHPEYEPGQCVASFAEVDASKKVEAITEVTCTLTPSSLDGRLQIMIVGKKGRPVPALAVTIRGPSDHKLVSDDTGQAGVELPPGRYTAYIDDPAYLIAVSEVEVAPREETALTLQVLAKPTRPRVVVREKQIVLRSQVSFATGSNEILPNSEPLLLEVADALLRDPSLELIEIQGHTDNRGGRELNMKLSQSRAEAVGEWLIRHGVEPARLVAKGYGPTRPIVPNITAHNRARNRRVQFRIVRRAGTSVAATR
ncbi:MAG: OmpA family protein [Myxococcales bacterium]|nr:OmpA family protein [Myxococcales bacterium]